ncbi:MAG: hypothetical protein MZV64_05130 [Ignavibacteriales bacterium]|nr:hypothetical protein [Ignavibacteriales bacterium]
MSGPLVLGPGLHGALDLRHAEHARRCSRTSRSSTRVRACSPPCRARSRRLKPSCSRRCRRPRASTRRTMKAPDVAYQGEPKFEPIEKTTLARAVNTDKDIIKFGDLYYMCFQGVWFMSKSATGPWEVATSIPKEIYEIPASSPAHNVTYVTVVEDSDDEWVTFAAVAAYTGVMVAWGCAVWGTGWYHPPYWGWGGYYPYYYPHYPSYGYGAWYNPWNGAYGRHRGGLRPVRRRRRERPLQPDAPAPTRAARRHGGRTARGARARPTTRGPAPTRRPARARTSTAAGARPRCSAVTSGPRPRA